MYVSKDALNHSLVIPAQKTVSEELKTWYFSYSAFWLTSQWGGYSPHPSGYATADF